MSINKNISFMKKKTFFSLVLALMSIVLMPSCDNGEYSPLKASTDSCQIVVSCVDRMEQDLLSDKEFLDAIKIEGDASHSIIRYDVITSGDKKALLFVAELPDQSDMTTLKLRLRNLNKLVEPYFRHIICKVCQCYFCFL